MVKMYTVGLLASFLFAVLSIAHGTTYSKYSQFCQQDSTNSPIPYAHFCVSVTAYNNPESLLVDLYVAIQLTRQHVVSRGWTAVGPGDIMNGGLMFVVYGDPVGGETPIVSVRTTRDHMPPQLISLSDAAGADFDLINGVWVLSEGGTYIADVSIVFTNCTLWPGTSINPFSKSQPWIWAQNADQHFPVYSFDADLEPHAPDSAGHGRFYLDMANTIVNGPTKPSFPPILRYKGLVGASKDSDHPSVILRIFSSSHAWLLHGVLMGLAFLVFFPTGVFLLRSGSSRAFRLHWIFQVSGTLSTVLGASIALSLHPRIIHLHQVFGLLMITGLGLQGLLGWKHHLAYIHTGQRTKVTKIHVWLGRSIMFLGPINIISGMILRAITVSLVITVSLALCLEVAGVTVYLQKAWDRNALSGENAMEDIERLMGKDDYPLSFVVGDSDGDNSMSVAWTLTCLKTVRPPRVVDESVSKSRLQHYR